MATVRVNVDAGSPAAQPFHARHGAGVLAPHPYWYVWPDIVRVLQPPSVGGG